MPRPPAPVRARDRGPLDNSEPQELLQLLVDLAGLQPAHSRYPRRGDRLVVALQHEDECEHGDLLRPRRRALARKGLGQDALDQHANEPEKLGLHGRYRHHISTLQALIGRPAACVLHASR
jgi:hypothetical protein